MVFASTLPMAGHLLDAHAIALHLLAFIAGNPCIITNAIQCLSASAARPAPHVCARPATAPCFAPLQAAEVVRRACRRPAHWRGAGDRCGGGRDEAGRPWVHLCRQPPRLPHCGGCAGCAPPNATTILPYDVFRACSRCHCGPFSCMPSFWRTPEFSCPCSAGRLGASVPGGPLWRPFWRSCLSPPVHAAQVIAEPAFLEGVKARGERLREGLRSALAGNPHVKEVRGLGLICGVQLDVVRPNCARSPVRPVRCCCAVPACHTVHAHVS